MRFLTLSQIMQAATEGRRREEVKMIFPSYPSSLTLPIDPCQARAIAALWDPDIRSLPKETKLPHVTEAGYTIKAAGRQ